MRPGAAAGRPGRAWRARRAGQVLLVLLGGQWARAQVCGPGLTSARAWMLAITAAAVVLAGWQMTTTGMRERDAFLAAVIAGCAGLCLASAWRRPGGRACPAVSPVTCSRCGACRWPCCCRALRGLRAGAGRGPAPGEGQACPANGAGVPLLPGVDAAQACALAERVRARWPRRLFTRCRAAERDRFGRCGGPARARGGTLRTAGVGRPRPVPGQTARA